MDTDNAQDSAEREASDSAKLVIGQAVCRVAGLMGIEEADEESARLLAVPEVRAAAEALISAVRTAMDED